MSELPLAPLLAEPLRTVPESELPRRGATGLAARLTPTVRGALEQMGATSVSMWRSASEAGAECGAAADVLDEVDDRLDELHDTLCDELLVADLALADALQTTPVARFYERPGDHAVHVAERLRHPAPPP